MSPRPRGDRIDSRGTTVVTRILAVTGAKGGTGKTTTSVNLAAALGSMGYRVELRDLDPQASATRALGQPPADDPLTVRAVPLRHTRLPDGFLILRPAGRSLIRVEQGNSPANGLVTPHAYWGAHLLLIDCPPALGNLTMAALAAADVALVPIEASPLATVALRDLAAMLSDLPAADRPVLRAVWTRMQGRRRLSAETRERIEAEFPGTVCDTAIPEDVRAAEAPGQELPLTLYAPNAAASTAYEELAREIAVSLRLPKVRPALEQ